MHSTRRLARNRLHVTSVQESVIHGHTCALVSYLPVLTHKRTRQIVFVGARSVDPAERRILKDLGIRVHSMHTIDKYGIGKVMEMTLDKLDNRPLHLSYDIDALDPGEHTHTYSTHAFHSVGNSG